MGLKEISKFIGITSPTDSRANTRAEINPQNENWKGISQFINGGAVDSNKAHQSIDLINKDKIFNFINGGAVDPNYEARKAAERANLHASLNKAGSLAKTIVGGILGLTYSGVKIGAKSVRTGIEAVKNNKVKKTESSLKKDERVNNSVGKPSVNIYGKNK